MPEKYTNKKRFVREKKVVCWDWSKLATQSGALLGAVCREAFSKVRGCDEERGCWQVELRGKGGLMDPVKGAPARRSAFQTLL